MQFPRRLLNFVLKYFEKPYLKRVEDVPAMRRQFSWQARCLFKNPPFASYLSGPVGVAGHEMPAQWVSVDPRKDAGIILYLHGGSYVFGAAKTHQAMLARLAEMTGLRAVLPEYRLAPENPFPAAVDDAVSAYQDLLARGYSPNRIALGGDSAGGGLVFALLDEIINKDMPKPGAVFAFSPWTDLTLSGDSLSKNANADMVLPANRAVEMRNLYLNNADPRDPRATPLLGCFTGAPPVMLLVGKSEILLDDSRRMAKVLRDQHVPVTLEEWSDMPHVWVIFQGHLQEADDALADVAHFLDKTLT